MNCKKCLSVLLALFMVLVLLPVSAAKADDVIEIGTYDELKAFAARVNNGEASLNAVLTADIAATDAGWNPIGVSYAYSGTFDGQRHSIEGLTVSSSSSYTGMFRTIGEGGKVQNLMLIDVSISGTGYAAGIAGHNQGTVQNCCVIGTVSGSGYDGGIVGLNNATVQNCYYACEESHSINGGGVAGLNGGTVRYCYYDSDKVSSSGAIASNSGTATSVEGLSTAQMTGIAASENMTGFAFGTVWFTTETYPTLRKPHYTVTVDNGTGGGEYYAGDSVTITANEPEFGMVFSGWDGTNELTFTDGDASTATATFTMPDRNVTVTALFERDANVIEISTYDNLKAFAERVNNGETSLSAVLTADIVATDTDFEPITLYDKYVGTFDGQGHSIVGLTVSSSSSYTGMFRRIGEVGKVQNLMLIDASISGSGYTAGIAGYNEGTVQNCCVIGTVSGSYYSGGIVGTNLSSGVVQRCYYACETSNTLENGGGVAGRNQGTVQYCYYDSDKVSASGAIKSDSGTATNVSGLSTAQMTGTAASENMTGFAFGTVWFTTETYPSLQNSVSYIDENGVRQSCAEYTLLTGGDEVGILPGGWYVAKGTVSYPTGLVFDGDVNLILADGCVLTAGNGENDLGLNVTGGNFYGSDLTVYGQTGQSGTLTVSGGTGIRANAFRVCGGVINTSESCEDYAIYTDTATIVRGSVTVTGGLCGIYGTYVTITGGNVSATGGSAEGIVGILGITLGWTEPTDSIYSNSYWVRGDGTISVQSGKTLRGDNGKTYAGTITDKVGELSGVTLTPAYAVHVTDSEHGSVTADTEYAGAGETVTLTVTPDEGCLLASLTAKDAHNNDVTVTDNAFTMPASDVTVTAVFSGVIEIGTYEELKAFAESVNNGETSLCAVLTADIVATDTDFTPIGYYYDEYNGVFDGQGHSIEGLTVSRSSNYMGMFNKIGRDGKVQNLMLIDATISGSLYTAGIVGTNKGTVQSCCVIGTVSGSNYSGGIAGTNEGTVQSCCVIGTVSGSNYSGGIAGTNEGTVQDCYMIGTVSGSGAYSSGIVGINRRSGVVQRCYYACESLLTLEGGGVAGSNQGTVQNCYYDSDKVSASGAIKSNSGTATNVSGLSTAQMTGTAASENMTGFAFGTVWFTTETYPTLRKPLYTVTVDYGTGGGEYAEGASVTITANDPADGMVFAGWTGTDGLTFTEGDASTATATFTMPDRNVTVTATFEAAPTYTVTVNLGTGGGEYTEGASVTITANEPEDGMIFTGWTGADGLTFTEGDATTATATFTMPAGDVTVTASFTAYWYILQEQFNDPGTDNVRMIANAIAPDGAGHMIIPAGKTVTLDLNGHTLNTRSKTFASYSDLTLKDTSSEKSGTITGTGTYVIQIGSSSQSAAMTFESGRIEAPRYAVQITAVSSLTMNGGSISGTYGGVIDRHSFILNGGKITSENYAVYVYTDASFEMNSGKVVSTGIANAINLYGNCSAVINGGTIEALYSGGAGGCGIAAFKNTTVTVNGGTITAYAMALAGNGSTSGSNDGTNAKFIITGGTLTSLNSMAIYVPQASGEVLISGGTITGATSGIWLRAGTLTVTAGTITGSTESYSSTNNGVTGSAIAVMQHTTNQPIRLNINGGTFVGYLPLSESTPSEIENTDPSQINYNISGGLFHSTGTAAIEIGDYLNGPFVSGGRFTYSVADYVMDGYAEKQDDNEDPYYVVPVPILPKFATHSLVLDGKIGVNFFMDLRGLSDKERVGTYMTFAISGAGSVSEEPIYFDEGQMNSDQLYFCFTCYVNAIQMADTITATYHYGDDQTVSEEYSIAQYIESFEENESLFGEKTVNLVHALADYGHYVQLYLEGVKEWSLGSGDDQYAPMDAVCTTEYDVGAIAEAVADYEIVRDNNSADIEKITYSVRLDSDTAILVYFKPVSNYSGSFTVTLDGDPYTATPEGRRYVVEIPNIGAHLLGTTYTIVAETDQGEATVEVSALSYVKSMLTAYAGNANAENAACAIYRYYAAAAAYMTEP